MQFFATNSDRATLRGRVAHVDDRYKPACELPSSITVLTTAVVRYTIVHEALFAGLLPREAECAIKYTSNQLNQKGEFQLEISAPSCTLRELSTPALGSPSKSRHPTDRWKRLFQRT